VAPNQDTGWGMMNDSLAADGEESQLGPGGRVDPIQDSKHSDQLQHSLLEKGEISRQQNIT
jgi:hypothetical protein